MEDFLDTSIKDFEELTYIPDKICVCPPTRQTIEIDVCLRDLLPYWGNKPYNFLCDSQDFVPYEYEDPYENLEYYCKYNYLFIGMDVIKSLLNRKNKKLKIAIYGYKNNNLPPFIKGANYYKPVPFEYSLELITYRKIINNSFYIKNIKNRTLLVQKTNIPYCYYSHVKQLPSLLSYDIDKKDFWATGSNYNEIVKFFNSYSHGIRECLNLQVNNKGELVKPLACNTRMLFALLYKVPYIPVNLCIIGNNYIFKNINTNYFKEDLDYANKYFEGNVLFKGIT